MIFRSPYPQIEIPPTPLTPFVLARARERGDKPALIDAATGRTITYRQLDAAVRRVAAGLVARGLRKGDVFAIYSPNVPEYVIAFHAVSLVGGTLTTLNPLYTVDEAAHQLRDARAKYLLTVPALLDKAREAAAHASVEEVFVFGECEGATPFAALYADEGASDGQEEWPRVEIDPADDVVVLPYSSGTTGLPKGVMLTHRNLIANTLQVQACELIDEADTLVCVLPLFHIYGMVVIMNVGLYEGARIVIMPRFDLEMFLGVLQDYGVTLAHVVPPIMLALAQHPAVDNYDLSQLKTLFSGAAPLSEQLARACSERLGCAIRQGYGMTETSPAIHLTTAEFDPSKLGSIGQCVPNTECKIVDVETGASLGSGQEGEICMRGPQMMKGYLNRPDATAATIDADGWLHTGDIGYCDESGHFYIVDRLKELIKYKGMQVAPAELEGLLLTHPSVADAAVVPVPDEEAGELPKAFVVRKPGADGVDAEELMAFVAARVAPYKKLRRLEFIEQIPKAASGKILRRLLVERDRAK
ncbi:MAG TPA: 4-coumarate--CoA ligase family protein [Pyrinomonadaceae bacterium]|jgi:acyl-CoA synthetase (AMP-forming)/AMP-acid ligase II|nr:4-coumarate--CoA ligase family protein [Pyrinomonadaceae bacterium]